MTRLNTIIENLALENLHQKIEEKKRELYQAKQTANDLREELLSNKSVQEAIGGMSARITQLAQRIRAREDEEVNALYILEQIKTRKVRLL